MEPNYNMYSRKASYQNANIADAGNLARSQDSLGCYMINIFYFHPDNLLPRLVRLLSILSSDKQHHLRMFSNTLMAYSMIPILIPFLHHQGLYNFSADINLLHAVVYVVAQDAVMER
jgi:hypothetical protein